MADSEIKVTKLSSKADKGFIAPVGGLSGRDVPLDKITIARLENLFSNTIRFNECRLRLNPHGSGYTYMNVSGAKYPAHRIVATARLGRSFRGKVVDHLCRNRSCIRPSHLEVVEHSENMRRGTIYENHPYAKKTHCINGHPFDNKNTYSYARVSGKYAGNMRRICRTCRAIKERERRAYAKKIK